MKASYYSKISEDDIYLKPYSCKMIPDVYYGINSVKEITEPAGYIAYKHLCFTVINWLNIKFNRNCLYYTIHSSDGRFLGIISLRKHVGFYMLGLQLVKSAWGKGVSDKAIDALLTAYKDLSIFAKIKNSNEYSLQCFLRNKAKIVNKDKDYTYVHFKTFLN